MTEKIENFIYKHSSPNGCVALTRMERDELFEMIEKGFTENELKIKEMQDEICKVLADPNGEIGQILDCANLGWYDKDKVEKLTNEKAILKDILKKALGEYDLCLLCESKGQYLPKCECMEDEECLQHMIKLWSNKK